MRTKEAMNPTERRRRDRILWLGLLALLLATACGASADSQPARTYRIRRLADSPVARTGHVAIALADGSALVMGGKLVQGHQHARFE
jgi:hypothetical protein